MLPSHTTVVNVYNNVNYYCNDGIYYRPYYGGGYVVCRPPCGTRFISTLFNTALTVALISELHDAVRRCENAARISAQYAYINSSYVPRTYQEISIHMPKKNTSYYYQDGVFYVLENNHYVVIEPPIGALITELPEDYEELIIDGTTYYRVEDTLYKVTVIDGALYFEVMCNL